MKTAEVVRRFFRRHGRRQVSGGSSRPPNGLKSDSIQPGQVSCGPSRFPQSFAEAKRLAKRTAVAGRCFLPVPGSFPLPAEIPASPRGAAAGGRQNPQRDPPIPWPPRFRLGPRGAKRRKDAGAPSRCRLAESGRPSSADRGFPAVPAALIPERTRNCGRPIFIFSPPCTDPERACIGPRDAALPVPHLKSAHRMMRRFGRQKKYRRPVDLGHRFAAASGIPNPKAAGLVFCAGKTAASFRMDPIR